MKKLIYSAAALAMMLFAGCQQELPEPVAQESTVTFSVELPGVQTKAIGDGFNVDQLVYEVWKTDGEEQRELWNSETATRLYQKTVPMATIDGEQKTTITLNLVHDQNYTVLFWAQNSDALGEDTPAYVTKDLRAVTYAKDVTDGSYLSNNENMAAFYSVAFLKAEEVEKPSTRRVELKRPFAQLNIATVNTPDEYKVTINKSKVKITNVPTVFNVAENIAAKPAEGIEAHQAVTIEKSFLFNSQYVPGCSEDDTEPLTITVNNAEYDYVAMNYIFALNNVEVEYWIDATLTPTNPLTGESNATATSDDVVITNKVPEVPLKENYRTNIIGNLLSSNTTYEVVVDASWDDVNDPDLNGDGYEVEVWNGTEVTEPAKDAEGNYMIEYASDLAWLAAVVNGDIPEPENPAVKSTAKDNGKFNGKTFLLTEDINLNNQLWTPIGVTSYFAGTFDGQGHTISNLTVETEGKAPAGLFGSSQGYIKNLTVKNANLSGHYKTGVIVGNGLCAKIENCHVDGATVLSTPYNNDDANHVGGIVGYLSAEKVAYVKNCSVKTASITGFRDVAGIAGTANRSGSNIAEVSGNTIENVTITADQTVAYVDNTKDGNAAAVAGRVHADANIVNNTVGENVVVIRKVDSTKELEYAVADAESGETIYIGAGEVSLPHFTDKSLNFVGIAEGATVLEPASAHNDTFWSGAELNFSDLTIKGVSYTGKANGYVQSVKETYANCNFLNYYMFAGDVTTVNKCTFDNADGQYFWTASADDITFNECKFAGSNRAVKVCTVGNKKLGRVVTFNNCDFTAEAQDKAAIEINATSEHTYTVNINNCTETGFVVGTVSGMSIFNVDSGDEEYVTVYIDGNKWVSTGKVETEEGAVLYTGAAGLQAALDAATEPGIYEFVLGGDITGDVTVPQNPGVTLVIDGNDMNWNGVITVNGKSSAYVDAALTIKDLTFTAESISAGAYINLGKEGDDNTRYTSNVTIENCKFEPQTKPSADIAAIKSYTGGDKNLTVIGCTASVNTHSLIQVTNVENLVKVEGCKVYSKNGMNFNHSANVTIDGCTVDVKGYAVRFGVNQGGNDTAESYSIKNSALKSANDDGDAVIILRQTSDNATLTIEETTLTGNPVITSNATDAKVYIDGTRVVTSTEDLSAAMSEGVEHIKLLPGDYALAKPTIKAENLLIEGTDKENCKVTITKQVRAADNVTTLTFKNLTVDVPTGLSYTEHDYAWFHYLKEFKMVDCISNGRIRTNCYQTTIENCTFNVTTSSGFDGYAIYYYGAPNSNVKVSGSTFNTVGKAIVMYNESAKVFDLDVDNCTFISTATTDKAAIQMHTERGISGTLDITKCTASGFADVNGGLWNELNNETKVLTEKFNITVDGIFCHGYKVDNGVYYVSSAEGLNTAITDGAEKIVLAKALYDGTFALKTAGTTIEGLEGAIVHCINLNGQENVTLKNITFDAAGAQMSYDYGGTARQTANIITGDKANKPTVGARNLLIEGCKFTGTFADGGAAIAFADKSRPTGGSGDVTIKNCEFNTTGASYDIYGYYTSTPHLTFTIDNNKFYTQTSERPVYLGRLKSSEPVVVKGNTFTKVSSIENAVYVQGDTNYSPTIDASDNTFAN